MYIIFTPTHPTLPPTMATPRVAKMSNMTVNKFHPCEQSLSSTSPIVRKVEEIISHAWGFPHTIHYNPSPNPISLEKKYLSQLESHLSEFVIAEKSDGIRYLLVLGTLDERGFCVLVNRKMQMFEVPVYANSDYFRGSVFDGEMVIEPVNSSNLNRQKLLIFDLISVKGETRRTNHFLQRYNEYFGIFDLEGKDILDVDTNKWETLAFEMANTKEKVVCLGNKMALQFSPKPFVQLINVGSMWRSMHSLKHLSDGLIIMRTNAPVGSGTDYNILKWKEHHTIDLIIQSNYSKGKWKYTIFFQNNERLVESSDQSFTIGDKCFYLQLRPNPVFDCTCQYYAETHKNNFSLLGECSCIVDTQQPIVWCSVVKWRKDKHTPNNVTVIQRTLNNIVENVTIDELIQLSTKKMYTF